MEETSVIIGPTMPPPHILQKIRGDGKKENKDGLSQMKIQDKDNKDEMTLPLPNTNDDNDDNYIDDNAAIGPQIPRDILQKRRNESSKLIEMNEEKQNDQDKDKNKDKDKDKQKDKDKDKDKEKGKKKKKSKKNKC